MTTTNARTDWDVAAGTGLLRIAVGAGLLHFRSPLIRLSGGSVDDPLLRAAFTYFGVRDIALGVGTLASSRPPGDVRRAVTGQGLADTTDAGIVGALVAKGRLPRLRGAGMIGIAAVSAAAEYAGAWWLGRR